MRAWGAERAAVCSGERGAKGRVGLDTRRGLGAAVQLGDWVNVRTAKKAAPEGSAWGAKRAAVCFGVWGTMIGAGAKASAQQSS